MSPNFEYFALSVSRAKLPYAVLRRCAGHAVIERFNRAEDGVIAWLEFPSTFDILNGPGQDPCVQISSSEADELLASGELVQLTPAMMRTLQNDR